MIEPIKILTFTPVYKRFEIFAICLKGLARLVNYKPEKFKIIPFFIVSGDEERDMVESFGFDYLFYKNEPLGEKKNAGLNHIVKNFDFDYLMEVGSDDLIADDYLDFIEPELKKKTPVFNISTVYFIDTVSGKSAKWETDIVMGAGRCIKKDCILNSFSVEFKFSQNMAGPDVHYQRKKPYLIPIKSAKQYELTGYGEIVSLGLPYLWNNEGERGMDTFSMNVLKRFGIENKIVKTDKIYLLDIKSRAGLNKFDCFIPMDETEKIFKRFTEAVDIKRLIEANNLIPIKRKKAKI